MTKLIETSRIKAGDIRVGTKIVVDIKKDSFSKAHRKTITILSEPKSNYGKYYSAKAECEGSKVSWTGNFRIGGCYFNLHGYNKRDHILSKGGQIVEIIQPEPEFTGIEIKLTAYAGTKSENVLTIRIGTMREIAPHDANYNPDTTYGFTIQCSQKACNGFAHYGITGPHALHDAQAAALLRAATYFNGGFPLENHYRRV